MSIPTKLSEADFQKYVEPYLRKARRGYVSSIPLYKIFNYILYVLYTGCQWHMIPIENKEDEPTKKEISYQAIYYHFCKWCRDGSFKKLFAHSIEEIRELLDLSELNLDGTHTIAKKGVSMLNTRVERKQRPAIFYPLPKKEDTLSPRRRSLPVTITTVMSLNRI